MKIILDVMGGDKEVSEFVRGAVWAKAEYGEEIVLVGDEEKIKEAKANYPAQKKLYQVLGISLGIAIVILFI